MRARTLPLTFAAAAVLLTAQQAYTASNSVAGSTLGSGEATVTGATMLGISWTYVDGTATGFTVTLQGSQLLKTVSASYADGGALTCATPVLNTDLLNTDVTCTGTAPRRGLPRVQVSVS